MSNTHEDGGPAFPILGEFDGMSLRDWFASQAMKALLGLNKYSIERVACDSYVVADTMLQERKELQHER